MIIGVPKEIKNNEYRVSVTPAGVRAFVKDGHQVIVERDAGKGSGIRNEEYIEAGALLAESGVNVYESAEMIIKVKEPLPVEYEFLKENQILFTYLHLAPAPALTRALVESRCIGVAYETIQLDNGLLPLLYPMSEVAGRVAPQVGAYYLEKAHGGRGVLLSGVPGVSRGKVTVLGGGVVGANAAKIAVGLGAEVYVTDIDPLRLAYLDDIFGNSIGTVMSNEENIARLLTVSDLVVGAVLVPGAVTPALVTRDMLAGMQPGSVLVDVAIDQGGCMETSRPTTHEDPVFLVDDIIHYCVANIPGLVPRTSTFALTNATLPYALTIAGKGIERAIREDIPIARGVNTYKGTITYPAVADAMGCQCEDAAALV